MFYDMPNATIDDITERINSESIPCNTSWGLEQVMETTAEMKAVDPAIIQTIHDDEGAAYGLQPSAGMQQQSSAGTQRQEAADSSIPMHNATIRNLQSTTNVHDRPGPYGTLPEAWQDAGSQLMSKVTNAKLAKYLIGMSSVIPMPESYWPEDGCQWSVTVMEHRPSKRHHGGHAFSVVLAKSTPAYTGGAATDNPYVAELSSKQIRNGIKQHFGKNKTLQQMFDPKWKNVPTGMAHAALAFKNQLIRSVNQTTGTSLKSTASSLGNFKRKESAATGQCAAIPTAMAVMTCAQNGIEFAGTPIVAPRHYHSVWGRPDEALWVEAMDKEVIKCFTMGTWQIVDTADIPTTRVQCHGHMLFIQGQERLRRQLARMSGSSQRQWNPAKAGIL